MFHILVSVISLGVLSSHPYPTPGFHVSLVYCGYCVRDTEQPHSHQRPGESVLALLMFREPQLASQSRYTGSKSPLLSHSYLSHYGDLVSLCPALESIYLVSFFFF